VLLERILLNLAANALRYTRQGGILIGCRRRGGRVRIEVWDTGIGIAPEQRQAIFQEFYQAVHPRVSGQGLGLGLAIAARLAALLGSRIEVASRPGKGSVFAVEVPRGEPPTAPCRSGAQSQTVDRPRPFPAATGGLPEQALEDAASGRGRPSYGALVLVVDDDALVREAMQSLLAQWGCTVAAAATGEEAVALLEGGDRLPDALLCDYRLPGGETGIEVIRRLQAVAGRAIPAALVSADTAPESLSAAKESGFPLLAKPVAPAKLRALVEHLVSAARP
jgi:CheY-like chemotaxis protein